MSDIYKQAQQVIDYLGEASHESQVGMDFILHDLQAISAAGEDRPSVGLSADSPSSPQQMAIDHILSRPYFERIWIIQEIVFARQVKIVLGDRTVDWEAFKRTAYYVDINKQVHLGGDRKLPRVLKYKDRATSFTSGKVSTSKPDALLELLRDMRMCKATDPRDKIHALLGMSVEKNEAALAPDYGLATRETFINLVKFLIGRDRRLDVLCHVQGKLPRHDLPSWVPDWSFPYSCHVFAGPYKASQGRLANVVFEHDPDVLVAEGKVFDKVSQVGPAYSLDGVSSFNVLQQWESMALTSSTNINASATFTNTLIAFPPYPAPNPFLRFYPSWRRRISSDSDISMDELSKASIFEEQVSKACNGRRFFLTEKGHMGLGPKDMQEGDVVAVLLGGSVPLSCTDRKVSLLF